jgi:hypothetical protein
MFGECQNIKIFCEGPMEVANWKEKKLNFGISIYPFKNKNRK